uniref:Uncharacterized protein n=1 Tax=Trypanosoma congolense (strain IL3000) TaxID=1068625 RepID=G0UXV4_TRYCI|nr:conserved hypothetical protein [Trypanosoma congolense IL3000]
MGKDARGSESSRGNDAPGTASKNHDEEMLDVILQRDLPKLYCYPRARAYPGLDACYRAIGGISSICPSWLYNVLPARNLHVGDFINGRVLATLQAAAKMESEDENFVKQVYPASKVPLVGESTAGMVDAIMRHLRMAKGATVFLPGLLLHPHYKLLELFERWGVRVVGYDVDFVNMRVDVDDIRRKAHKLGLPRSGGVTLRGNLSQSRLGESCGVDSCSALFFIIAVGGRPISNASSVTRLVRTEFRALTVELCPLTAALMQGEAAKISSRCDISVVFMDGAGGLGGALAFADDPLLERGIFLQLQKQPIGSGAHHFTLLVAHIVHLLFSDRRTFRLLLYVLPYYSVLVNKVPTRRSQGTDADDFFSFLEEFVPKQSLHGLRATPGRAKKGVNQEKQTVALSGGTDGEILFSKPHPGLLGWMKAAVVSAKARVESECFSLWEFLSSLRDDVEVVSAGEPSMPLRCVPCHSNAILMRVPDPKVAAAVLRSAGLDAVPVASHSWGEHRDTDFNEGKANWSVGGGRLLSFHDAVLLPECRLCCELSKHALYVPLYPSIKGKSREKLRHVMQTASQHAVFRSSCDDFHLHVANSEAHHAYRSPAVDALMASCRHHASKSADSGGFVPMQPFFLWCLLGPVPYYLISKL